MKGLLIALTLVLPALGFAADANSTAPLKIGTAEAEKHIDETVTVTGKVAQVTFRPKIVFLNMDQPFPNSPFSAVVMSKDTNNFGDLKALEGKSVEVTGKLKEFKDKPEMVLASSNQLVVVSASTNVPAK